MGEIIQTLLRIHHSDAPSAVYREPVDRRPWEPGGLALPTWTLQSYWHLLSLCLQIRGTDKSNEAGAAHRVPPRRAPTTACAGSRRLGGARTPADGGGRGRRPLLPSPAGARPGLCPGAKPVRFSLKKGASKNLWAWFLFLNFVHLRGKAADKIVILLLSLTVMAYNLYINYNIIYYNIIYINI